MKRVFLFVLTNVAILLTLSIIANLLGIQHYLNQHNLALGPLLVIAAIMGFAGSFISLLLSKQMALWSTGATVITGPQTQAETWLLDTVHKFADQAGIGHPDVAIYDSDEPNAFATGASRNSALVAVSTGLLNNMNESEIKGVLAHEISHIANGDMITMTLMQGTVNTFTIFLARVIGFFVDRVLLKNNNGRGIGYYVTVFVSEIILTLLGSILLMWYSRVREYKADEGSAELANPHNMIDALNRLKQLSVEEEPESLPKSIASFGINGRKGFIALFRTHPDLDERIEHLKKKYL